jgi:hypothetical protein
MTRVSPSDLTRIRVNRWIESAKSLETNPTWTETRLVIDFGGHTFPVTNGQIYQCAHCGHFDPEWNATEVLTFFKDNFGIKPYEIEVTCSVAVIPNGV